MNCCEKVTEGKDGCKNILAILCSQYLPEKIYDKRQYSCSIDPIEMLKVSGDKP
jgi:hypothetical protein